MELRDQILERLRGDKNAEVEDLISEVKSLELKCSIYSTILKEVYWLDRSATRVVHFGARGIQLALEEAKNLSSKDPDLALSLKGWAKVMAYDVGANTWPGWGDQEVRISEDEMKFGLEMAKLNLGLTTELKRSNDRLSLAHWLLGAHLLAQSKNELACGAFEVAKEISLSTGEKIYVLLYDGYIALTDLLEGKPSALTRFQRCLRALEDLKSSEASSYISQLQTALSAFAKI